MTIPAIIARDNSGWFERLCAEHDLIPLAPRFAWGLAPGVVVFTATGNPFKIVSVRRHVNMITIVREDGWTETVDRAVKYSLVAAPAKVAGAS